ncbi:uncharacterized protein LOC133549201 isoform X2 [Nerophis ophidion]|uniref:uncharacterized protein LOC133549201 isoform X2 n=1 Tax=Nerophis ophidion TaxID=159077 RepID=UPI002ADF1502|nr:uncharacterized protein LOC133549201 isoform X2 [Nerophis ophidion]
MTFHTDSIEVGSGDASIPGVNAIVASKMTFGGASKVDQQGRINPPADISLCGRCPSRSSSSSSSTSSSSSSTSSFAGATRRQHVRGKENGVQSPASPEEFDAADCRQLVGAGSRRHGRHQESAHGGKVPRPRPWRGPGFSDGRLQEAAADHREDRRGALRHRVQSV